MSRTDKSQPLPLDIALSSAGYFAVAVVCGLAGYDLSHAVLLPRGSDWCGLGILWTLLLPFYINRAILYEEVSPSRVAKPEDERFLRQMAWQAPLTGAIIAGLILLVACLWTHYSPDRCLVE